VAPGDGFWRSCQPPHFWFIASIFPDGRAVMIVFWTAEAQLHPSPRDFAASPPYAFFSTPFTFFTSRGVDLPAFPIADRLIGSSLQRLGGRAFPSSLCFATVYGQAFPSNPPPSGERFLSLPWQDLNLLLKDDLACQEGRGR